MWVELRDSFKEAMLNRNIDQWFVSQSENRSNMRTEYISIGSAVGYLAILNHRAAFEEEGLDQDIALFTIGGHSDGV